MGKYVPGAPPPDVEAWLLRELQAIAQALETSNALLQLDELHAAPKKPRAGMVALADGTDWNPGSGAGFYGYYGGAWNKLG